MKLSIAVATLFTVAAPAAFAQSYNTYDPYYSTPRETYREAYRGNDLRDRELRRDDRDNFARVIESRPLYAEGTAKTECFNPRAGHYEELRDSGDTRIGKGAAVGALAGGVLGHQVDHGGGTAAGAVIGGLLGHHLQKRNDRDDQPDLDRSRCRTVAEGDAPVVGYDVRYEYDGREYVTRLDRDPGRRLRVGRDINADGTPLNGVASYDNPRYGYTSR